MRRRVPTLLLALTGLLVAIAVGLVANAIANRSFTPGVDALPSAGSLAPAAPPRAGTAVTASSGGIAARGAQATATTTPAPATTPARPKPSTGPKPVTAPVTVATPVPGPVSSDDHGGSGKGSGKSGSGDSSGHGKHGDD